MKRIGFSGTNWTRKSTLISNLMVGKEIDFVHVSLSDNLKDCPFPKVELQTIDTSIWMKNRIGELITNRDISKIQLFDRTAIDILAFTLYAFERDNQKVDMNLMNEIHGLISTFDKIYFIKPSDNWAIFEWKESNKISFALLMNWYMQRVIELFNIKVEYLPYDMTKRVEICNNYIENGKSN